MKKLLAIILFIVLLLSTLDIAIADTQYVKVLLGSNVRSAASSNAAIIGYANEGDQYLFVSKEGTWYLVQYTSSKMGYIAASRCQIVTKKSATKTTTPKRTVAPTKKNINSTPRPTAKPNYRIVQIPDFVLRNGIRFGMKSYEVISKETMRFTNKTSRSCQACGGTVAGYKNAGVHYNFDESGKLYHMYYFFDDQQLTTKTKVNDEYQAVRASLIEKYGEPLGYKNGKFFKIIGKGLEHYKLLAGIGSMAISFSSAYDEWVVETSDGFVKIEHFATFQHGQKGDLGSHNIHYQYYTKQEWNNLMNSFDDL